jgi:dephospho-CoA kinase
MSNRPHLVGLTGGIGAGKSTVTEILDKMGIPVFDCDAEVHKLYHNKIVLAWLNDRLNITEEGDQARAHAAAMATADPQRVLPILNMIFTPGVQQGIEKFKIKHKWKHFVVLDAPLLFESKLDRECDFSVVISCPEEIRRLRVKDRPGMSTDKLDMILKAQLTETERRTRANYTVDNTGTLDSLATAVKKVFQNINTYYANGDMI